MTPFQRMLAGTPLAQAMQLHQVAGALEAPFAPSRNQLDVAFGGAMAAGMALAGWVFVAEHAEAVLDDSQNPLLAGATQRFFKPFVDPTLRFQVDPVDQSVMDAWAARWRANQRVRAPLVARVVDRQGDTFAEAELNFVL